MGSKPAELILSFYRLAKGFATKFRKNRSKRLQSCKFGSRKIRFTRKLDQTNHISHGKGKAKKFLCSTSIPPEKSAFSTNCKYVQIRQKSAVIPSFLLVNFPSPSPQRVAFYITWPQTVALFRKEELFSTKRYDWQVVSVQDE